MGTQIQNASERKPKFYTVGDVVSIVQKAVVEVLPVGIWVKGEVLDYKGTDRKGNAYFELVERRPGKRDAVLSAASWSSNWPGIVAKLKACDVGVQNGQEMLFFGKVKVFEAKGRVTLDITDVSVEFSLGKIEQKRLQTHQRLKAEGLFYPNKQKTLTDIPLRLGIVGARDTKGMRDLIQTLKRSGFPFKLHICDVPVQGANMEMDVCTALRTFAAKSSVWNLDAICIVRGGGSTAELVWWNSYAIGATIANMPLPVICGIAHDDDRVAIDEVVHTRCSTPTSVGEFLVKRVLDAERSIDALKDDLIELTLTAIRERKLALGQSRENLSERAESGLSFAKSALHVARTSLTTLVSATVREQRSSLRTAKQTVISNASMTIRGIKAFTRSLWTEMKNNAVGMIHRERQDVLMLAENIGSASRGLLRQAWKSKNQLAVLILHGLHAHLQSKAETFRTTKYLAEAELERIIPRERRRLEQLREILMLCDPASVLSRGYSITYDDAGKRIKNAGDLKPDSVIRTVLAVGKFKSRVLETEQPKEKT